jgi:HlyD family secretion protein
MLKKNRSYIMLKFAVIAILCGSFSLAFLRFGLSGHEVDSVEFRTVMVQRKSISTTISATGTLEPSDIIDVGAQVAGRVTEFGIDPDTGEHLDYGSRVTKGMLLARIDPSVYEIEVAISEAQSKRSESQVAQARAQLKEAESSVHRSEAELLQQQSKLERTEREWHRSQGLAKTNSISAAEFDAVRSDYESLRAAVIVSKAAIEQARCRLESQRAAITGAEADAENAQAVLKRSKTTLSYCTIVSPIDGVIIDRRVSQGQTVVASLSTPSLFLLASDLRQLEIWVSVNEADIGQIKPKMPVRFTVDSLPDQTFKGAVKQIRLNASMSQNVVTYTVVVSVVNESDLLIPYLTANVEFIVNERLDVLCVPTTALRFQPKEAANNDLSIASTDPTVWLVESGKLRGVPVQVGISDGSLVEITSSELTSNCQTATGYLAKSFTQASNPFVPRMKSNKREAKK